jgi:hypothetical protein
MGTTASPMPSPVGSYCQLVGSRVSEKALYLGIVSIKYLGLIIDS